MQFDLCVRFLLKVTKNPKLNLTKLTLAVKCFISLCKFMLKNYFLQSYKKVLFEKLKGSF